MFHCVNLSQPIKSFPLWPSRLFLLWNIFPYFDIDFLNFLSSWMIFHCVSPPHSMNTHSPSWLWVQTGPEPSWPQRHMWGLNLWLRAEAMGMSGDTRAPRGSVTDWFDQPCWTFISLLFIDQSCTPKLLSQDVSKCPLPPLHFLLLFFKCYAKPLLLLNDFIKISSQEWIIGSKDTNCKIAFSKVGTTPLLDVSAENQPKCESESMTKFFFLFFKFVKITLVSNII